MSIIIYTKYLQENAIFLQECVLKSFTGPYVNIFLKERLYIIKYLEYLGFFVLNNPLDFYETNEYQKIMSYHDEIYDYKKDSDCIHDFSSITPTQKNIRELVDNVIIQKYFKPNEKR